MNIVLAFFGLLVGGFVASEIGFRAGRVIAPQDEPFGRQLDVIRTAVFALVAFLIGFAFSGAGSRYVDRIDIIVKEANALGTAWLRAEVLPEPQRGQLKAALKEYAADRVVMLSTDNQDEILRLLDKVPGLQQRMWAHALEGTKGDAPLMNVVLPSVNDVIDLHTTHLSLVLRHLPTPILLVLLLTAALALVLVGFGNGRVGRRFPILDGIYASVLAIALWMTIDLDHPRQGAIQLSIRPIVDTLAGMK
jgi:hypothetical protein